MLKLEGRGIQAEISDTPVQLQLQNRVVQVLSQVKNNIGGLHEVSGEPRSLKASAGPLQAVLLAPPLAELQSNCAMAEEFEAHARPRTAGQAPSRRPWPTARSPSSDRQREP